MKTNEKGFSDAGKENLKGLAVLCGIGLLVVFLIGTLTAGVPTVSAATASTVNITTGIVENTAVIWISVDGGTHFMCIDNLCSNVHVPVEDDCPTCPTCPSINFTEVEGNLTAKMGESYLLFETLFAAHNSSALEEEDRDYIDTKVSEGASYSASQVWEYLNQTLMPSRMELEDKDTLIVSLKDSLRESNNTINLQGEELRNYEETTNDLKFDRTLYAILLAIFFGLVIVMYASKQGVLGDYRGRIKEGFGGLMPEEKKLRKLQEIEEENTRLEEEIKIEDAERKQNELKQSLNHRVEGGIVVGRDPISTQKEEGAMQPDFSPKIPESPTIAATAAATMSGGVSLKKKRKERVMAIINFIEGKEEYAHNEAEIVGWYMEQFEGMSENTAKLEWSLARNMIEETFLGGMTFVGTPKEGLRFAKNG